MGHKAVDTWRSDQGKLGYVNVGNIKGVNIGDLVAQWHDESRAIEDVRESDGDAPSTSHEFAVFYAAWCIGILAQARSTILFVFSEIPLVKYNATVVFVGENVRCNTI